MKFNFFISTHIIVVIGLRDYRSVEFARSSAESHPNAYYAMVKFHPLLNTTVMDYDMALLITNKSMTLVPGESQPICLPEANITNNEFEYALISGWGDTGLRESVFDARTNKTTFVAPQPEYLKLGWTQIMPNNASLADHLLTKIVPYPGGDSTCMVNIQSS